MRLRDLRSDVCRAANSAGTAKRCIRLARGPRNAELMKELLGGSECNLMHRVRSCESESGLVRTDNFRTTQRPGRT